jgi:hypothetical protein
MVFTIVLIVPLLAAVTGVFLWLAIDGTVD